MSDLSLPTGQLLINGQWRDARASARLAVLNPATGAPLSEVACAGADDMDDAVRAARAAFEGPWGRMPGAERGRILLRMAALLRERFDEIAVLESVDAGKPLAATRRQDLPAAIDCLEYYAGWADKLAGECVPARADALTYVRRDPVGVVAAIVPWNFPLMNAVWKVAPALACGCTVVLKPAELTPLSALLLGEIGLAAGLPPGVLNVLPGLGTVAGQALVDHPQVDKISFTGSPTVGRHIMRSAAGSLKRVGLELGGKSANVVFADANLELAVKAAASGIFFNAGQVCSAGSRILVDKRCHGEFVERLADRASRLRQGDPLDPRTTIGPLISAPQQQRVLSYIASGIAEGAKLECGGECGLQRGYFVQPTVFSRATPDMRITREEIFGPVATVLSFDSEEEAVRLANDSAYSLAAAVWSRDISRAHRVAQALRAGTVWVNTYGHTDTRLPWGGCGGESGVGRDLGRAALDNYTEARTVWINLAA